MLIWEDCDWSRSEEGSVPHPCLAAGAASVTTSSLDRGYLSPAPPQNDSALKPTSPGRRHGNQMTHSTLCIVMENEGRGYVGGKSGTEIHVAALYKCFFII